MATRMNRIWIASPRPREYYIFGKRGSGRNATIVTLDFAKSASLAKKKLAAQQEKYQVW